jgi:putative tricarboxylic transport membrane protein
MGMFALSEVFIQAASINTKKDTGPMKAKSGMRIAPFAEWWMRKGTLIKSAVIGTFIGALPGTGSSLAVFVSYGEAKRAGTFRDKLGTGEPEGLIASEAANNAVCGGALIPTLALGIPGDAESAVIMSALIIQGIQPGVRLLVDNPGIIYTAFVALAVINICMLFIAYLTSFAWTRVLSIPRSVLFSLVTIFALVGSYGVRGNQFDILVALFAGILGFFIKRAGYSVIPLVIGMVLGPMLELSMRQSLIITDGNIMTLFVGNPIATFIFALVIVFLFGPLLLSWRTQKKDAGSIAK